MDELILRLADRLRHDPVIELDARCVHTDDAGNVLPPRPANPPLAPTDVDYVEAQVGFSIPPILRRISIEVADGGFGPNWGINRLKHPPGRPFGPEHEVEMSVESWHQLYHENGPHDWRADFPARFIRYCEVGCNISLCVDCTCDAGHLFIDDPMEQTVKSLGATVEQWLVGWLDGQPRPQAS